MAAVREPRFQNRINIALMGVILCVVFLRIVGVIPAELVVDHTITHPHEDRAWLGGVPAAPFADGWHAQAGFGYRHAAGGDGAWAMTVWPGPWVFQGDTEVWSIEAPALPLLGLPAGILLWRWRRYRQARRRWDRVATGCCVECGYDLRASRERCPECGTRRAGVERSCEGIGSSSVSA